MSQIVQSMFGCRGGGLYSVLGLVGNGGGYGGYGGAGFCGTDSIFHHWTCCPYNPVECCIQLETWVIVFLVIGGCFTFICLLLCLAGCIWNYRQN
ncbi:unnamed protein product [Auanema sp. JU1783]|nr:unnamed protein product [Auanema sp. JU1783]